MLRKEISSHTEHLPFVPTTLFHTQPCLTLVAIYMAIVFLAYAVQQILYFL